MKFEFLGQIFRKYSNIKFPGSSSGGGRTIPLGRTDGGGGADMTKLIAVFRNFANAPKKIHETQKNVWKTFAVFDYRFYQIRSWYNCIITQRNTGACLPSCLLPSRWHDLQLHWQCKHEGKESTFHIIHLYCLTYFKNMFHATFKAT